MHQNARIFDLKTGVFLWELKTSSIACNRSFVVVVDVIPAQSHLRAAPIAKGGDNTLLVVNSECVTVWDVMQKR